MDELFGIILFVFVISIYLSYELGKSRSYYKGYKDGQKEGIEIYKPLYKELIEKYGDKILK